MNISAFSSTELNDQGNRNSNWVRLQGERCLVSLRGPVICKDGKEYKYFLGNCFVGNMFNYYTTELVAGIGLFIRVGNDNNPNRVILPLKFAIGFQPCEKVIKNERILVIED